MTFKVTPGTVRRTPTIRKSSNGKRMPTTAANRDYYAKGRARLEKELGGKCACCGSEENLQFDHIDPADKEFSRDQMRTKSRWQRLAYYRKKIALGQLQLLCRPCNSGKKDGEQCPCRGKGWGS